MQVLLGLKWSGAPPRSEYSVASGHMERNSKARILEIVRTGLEPRTQAGVSEGLIVMRTLNNLEP
jgi:hypothetical protein